MKKNFRPVFCMGGNTSAAGLRARRLMFAGGKTQMSTSGDDDLDINTDLALQGRKIDTSRAVMNPGLGPATGADNLQYSPASRKPFDANGLITGADKVLTAATPYISNIANSLRTAPMPKVPGMVSPVTLSKIRLDATRAKASNTARAQDLAADRSLDEQSAAAVRGSNLARNLEAQGQISEQEAFLNARQKAEAAGMNLNVDAMNTGAMNKYQDEMTGRNIAIQRGQSENLANAVDKNIAIRNEAAKGKLDLQKLQTLSQIWKESGVYDRLTKKMKGEGNSDPTGILGQMDWLGNAMDKTKAFGGMTYAFGGVKGTVAKGYLNPFGNTRSLGLGPGIEKSKFNPAHIRHTQHNLLATGGSVKTDGASDVNLNWTNYGDATPDLYEYGGIGGGYAFGGDPVVSVNSHQMAANQAGALSASRFRSMINSGVSGGVNPMAGKEAQELRMTSSGMFSDPANRKVIDAVYAFNQRPESAGMNPQQRLESFYSMNSLSPEVQRYRDIGKSAGYGPTGAAVTQQVGAQEVQNVNANYSQPANTIGWTQAAMNKGWNPSSHALGGPFQEEWAHGGRMHLKPRLADHSMWKQPYKENALTNNDPNPYMAMGGEFSGETTSRDMSMWNRKVWCDAGDPGMDIMADGGVLPGRKAYNPNLAGADIKFQQWYKQNTPEGKRGMGYTPNGDYDYYSYFRNGDAGNYQGGHFPDTYKRPIHKTFSDESIYSVPGNTGGHWNGDVFKPAMAGGGWISKAVNPAHKGFCTPMTKATCTPRRKAFAMTMKKHHGFH